MIVRQQIETIAEIFSRNSSSVTGLLSGVVISLPAALNSEHTVMPLLAGIGVLGGLLRDLAPDTEEIWRFSFFDLSIYRFFKESKNYRRASFHLLFFVGILVAEAVRQGMNRFAANQALFPRPNLAIAAEYLTTVFAVFIPLKIWNSMRNEKKLEVQKVLEFFGQEAVARVVRDSPKLHEPAQN